MLIMDVQTGEYISDGEDSQDTILYMDGLIEYRAAVNVRDDLIAAKNTKYQTIIAQVENSSDLTVDSGILIELE